MIHMYIYIWFVINCKSTKWGIPQFWKSLRDRTSHPEPRNSTDQGALGIEGIWRWVMIGWASSRLGDMCQTSNKNRMWWYAIRQKTINKTKVVGVSFWTCWVMSCTESPYVSSHFSFPKGVLKPLIIRQSYFRTRTVPLDSGSIE